jgi:hypothetical protein
MNKTILIAFALTVKLSTSIASAQGTLQASNLGLASTGSGTVGSDSWIAQGFGILATDPNTYALNSIQLLMNPALGNPTGFSVSIYSSLNPADNLGNLTGSAPSAGGVFTYTASGITLSSGVYFVVVTAATPIAQGNFVWSAAHGSRNGNWYINDVYATSDDGLNWTGYARQNVFQMAIYATPVPEPSAGALLGLSLSGLGFWRLQQKTAKRAL